MSDITAVRQSGAWSAEAKQRVCKLWLEGHSASVIANIVGVKSRNAIIGVVHRMGLSRSMPTLASIKRPGSGKWSPERRKRHSMAIKAAKRSIAAKADKQTQRINFRKSTAVELEKSRAEYEAIKRRIAAMPTPATAKPLLDLEDGDCRWPYGDGPYVFCGCKKVAGTSYCHDHLILSKARVSLADASNYGANAHINLNPFGLEELAEKETAAA